MSIIKSISGLRATLDGDLSPELVMDYTNALVRMFPKGKITIGRDGRPSGKWIESIVSATLLEAGCEVILLGIVPTPTVQLAVERHQCNAGIAITASHNPSNWNGLKFINSAGIFFNQQENELLWGNLNKELITKPGKSFNYNIIDNDIKNYHIDKLLNLNIINQNLNSIREKHYRVVVDAVNASGSLIVPDLLVKMGCEVIELFCKGNGEFPHLPEPLPQNLSQLAESVKQYNADLGIAVDPDADRLVLIDENGMHIGEEKTVCIAIDSVLSYKAGDAVINYSTSALAELIAKKYDSKVFRSPVGEINVVDKMKLTGAVIGGEGSGGVILPECHYGRDCLVGIALTLNLLTKTGLSLSELNKSYPELIMIKTKQDFVGDFDLISSKVKSYFKQATIADDDGIRADFGDKWVQIRKSNTEPIIRIIAEATNKELAQDLIEQILYVIR